jgi:hypothetical protein
MSKKSRKVTARVSHEQQPVASRAIQLPGSIEDYLRKAARAKQLVIDGCKGLLAAVARPKNLIQPDSNPATPTEICSQDENVASDCVPMLA